MRILFTLTNSVDPDEIQHQQHFIWVFTVCKSYPVCLSIYGRHSQDNLKQGLGVIYSFHVSVENIIFFFCMLHYATEVISAYN